MKENHEVSDQKVDSSNPEQLTIPQSLSIDFRWAQKIQAQIDQAEQADWPIDWALNTLKDLVTFAYPYMKPWTDGCIPLIFSSKEEPTQKISAVITPKKEVFAHDAETGSFKNIISENNIDEKQVLNMLKQSKKNNINKAKQAPQQAPEMSQPIERWDAITQEERDKFYQEYTKNMHQQAMNWISTPQEINNSNEQQEIQEKPLDMETVNQQFQELCDTIGNIDYKDDNWIYRAIKINTIKNHDGTKRTEITIHRVIDKYTWNDYALINENGKYRMINDVYENGVKDEKKSINQELNEPQNIAKNIKTTMDRYQEAKKKVAEDNLKEQHRRTQVENKNSDEVLNNWTYNNTHSNSDIQRV